MAGLIIPQLPKTEAQKYSKVWTYNGVAITLDDTSIQFATDFANLAVKGFIESFVKVAPVQPSAPSGPESPTQSPTPEPKKLVVEG